jgi:hypothetical protein
VLAAGQHTKESQTGTNSKSIRCKQVFISWATEQAGFIDNLKVKKEIKIFPVKFTAQGQSFFVCH